MGAALRILFVLAVMSLSAHSVCDFQYDCGCLPPFFGGTDHCNVQVATTPNCPWCTGGVFRALWVGAIIMAPVALTFWWAHRRRLHGAAAVVLALAAYLLGALIAGLFAAWVVDYPTWLGIAL